MRTVGSVRILKSLALLGVAVSLGACSSSSSDSSQVPSDSSPATAVTTSGSPTTATSMTPPTLESLPEAAAIKGLVDDAAEDGFACRLGTVSVARAGADSLFSSFDEAGSGLQIVTLDWVSYARFTGSLDADASQARRSVVNRLDGRWGTWGQPDTITLEELPVSPSACLEWVGLDLGNVTDVRLSNDGSVIVDLAVTDKDMVAVYGEMVAVTFVFDDDSPRGLRVSDVDGTEIATITLGDSASASVFRALAPAEDAVTIDQDEYFALVGG